MAEKKDLDVAYVAKLARLTLTEEETRLFQDAARRGARARGQIARGRRQQRRDDGARGSSVQCVS